MPRHHALSRITLSVLLLLSLALPVIAEPQDESLTPRLLSGELCMFLSGDADIPGKAYAAIQRRMESVGYHNPTNAQMVEFLNTHKDDMTCIDPAGETKNYMFSAIDNRRWHHLFNSLFLRKLKTAEGGPVVDVNVVSYTGPNGAPETLLDYIDRFEIENQHIKNIDKHIGRLRGLLVKKFGAKYFHELPAEVQQRYLDNKPK